MWDSCSAGVLDCCVMAMDNIAFLIILGNVYFKNKNIKISLQITKSRKNT